MRRKVLTVVVAAFLGLSSVAGALAVRNPSGTGQPNQTCPEPQNVPGFANSAGFENAEAHYAGEEDTASANHAHSEHAVSQYDVACTQRAASGH